MADTEKARLLSLLEAHGKSFLDSFPTTSVSNKRKNGPHSENVVADPGKNKMDDEDDDEEEWFGIDVGTISEEDLKAVDGDCQSGSDFEQSDDEFTGTATGKGDMTVVVFSEPIPKKKEAADYASKTKMKAFMSSKISKLAGTTDIAVGKGSPKDKEEDRTNAQNDALLHKLVHTKLLSGSLNTELDLPPAKRRKALAGRVLELTGEAKLGKGEKSIRDAEKKKAAKRVREGISDKQKQRGEQELEEAKNLGNYHPTLKKVFEASASSKSTRKRDKGLNMGVGKFSNGSLRLSREDASIGMGLRGHCSSSSGRGRGRGGVRGKRK